MIITAFTLTSHALTSFLICKHDPYYFLHQIQTNLIKVNRVYNFRFHKSDFDFIVVKVILKLDRNQQLNLKQV